MSENKQIKIVHFAVILLLMIGFGFLPPVSTITPFGMKMLGIFIGLVYAWTVNIIMWPSLLALILFSTAQSESMLSVLSGALGSQNMMMTAMILVFCAALDACGLMDWIGQWFMRQKILTKGPYYMLAAFWLVGFIGSALCLTNLNVMLMLWMIFYSIADALGIKRYSAYSNVMLIGIAVISFIGSVLFPFALWPQMLFNIYASATGVMMEIPYILYIEIALLIGAFSFVVGLLVTKFVIRPQVDFDFANLSLDDNVPKMSRAQKFALFAVLLMVVFILLSIFLPTEWLLTTWMVNMGTIGYMLMLVILLSFFKDEKTNKPVINLATVIKEGLDWNQFFILALAFYMASKITSEATGISGALLGVMEPLLAGKGAILTIVIFVVVSVVITNCLNNMVCASLMIPIAALLAPVLGINPVVLIICLIHALVHGSALPSGSAIGALLHANKDWLKSTDVYKYTILYTSIVTVGICLVGIVFC